MDYYNSRSLRESSGQQEKPQLKSMDISTERFVEMNNKLNNLVQHKVEVANKMYDRKGKDKQSKGAESKNPEDDPNEFYDILWNGFIFLKKLGVLRNVYKNLKHQPETDKKVDFLKSKDKLMREKPLNVVGIKVPYSDTSISISEKDQLPSFKKALLDSTLPAELRRKQKRNENKVNEEELLEEIDEEMNEGEIEEEQLQLGRTTLSKKDYERTRKRKIAKLKELYPDIPRKKIPKEPDPITEDANLEPGEEQDMIEPEQEMEEEEAEGEKLEPVKLPKSKRRRRKKKEEIPAMSPCEVPLKPGYIFRKRLEKEKTLCSCNNRKTILDPKRKKTRWSYDERHTRNPSIAVKVEM